MTKKYNGQINLGQSGLNTFKQISLLQDFSEALTL